MSSAISSQPNAYCANEIFYEPRQLDRQLARVRMALIAGLPVPNRYDREGKLTTDTRRDGWEVNFVRANGEFDQDCLVASKAHTLYLDELDILEGVASRIVALVRAPLFTLASWNTSAVQIIPEYQVAPEDLHPRWAQIRFPTTDRIERQAFLWKKYATLIAGAAQAGRLNVVCYEDFADPGIDLARIERAVDKFELNTLYARLQKLGRTARVEARPGQ